MPVSPKDVQVNVNKMIEALEAEIDRELIARSPIRNHFEVYVNDKTYQYKYTEFETILFPIIRAHYLAVGWQDVILRKHADQRDGTDYALEFVFPVTRSE